MNAGKTMCEKVEEYLSLRRRLGFQLNIEGRQLQRFARYADSIGGSSPLTTELLLGWVSPGEGSTRFSRARRLEVIRPFARYLSCLEPQTEVPPRSLFGSAHRRIQPYIYSDKEVTHLIDEAKRLAPVNGLRPKTYATLIGLMASTGLRTSEALKLERDDVDLERGILSVKETKFHSSRLIPLHASSIEALRAYVRVRDAQSRPAVSTRFLLSEQGRTLLPSVVHYTFQKLRQRTRVSEHHVGRPPRLYDLRHTFASKRLLQWYREGVDVNHSIALLSTYMGHVKVSDTYWYLSGVPELFAIVGRRFEVATNLNDEEVTHE